MTTDEWLNNLKHGVGIFDPEKIKSLEPDKELIAFCREVIRVPWLENTDDEFHRLETSAIAYLALVGANEAVHDIIAAELEAERINHAWIPEIVPQAIGAFGKTGFEAASARILELEQDTAALVSLESKLYWHYWSLVIALSDVAVEHHEFEAAFVTMTKQRLQNPDFPDQLTELWVGSVQTFKSSSSLEPLIQALFAKNHHTKKRGFTEWLETREQNLTLTLPSSREFAQGLLLEIREEFLEQQETSSIKFRESRTFNKKIS